MAQSKLRVAIENQSKDRKTKPPPGSPSDKVHGSGGGGGKRKVPRSAGGSSAKKAKQDPMSVAIDAGASETQQKARTNRTALSQKAG